MLNTNASPSSQSTDTNGAISGGGGSSGSAGSINNSNANNTSSSGNLAIFCREVRNLLRSKPNCMIAFSKFVPAYHNHYGRQCCVYQFGYTKLIELLEAIPHVVQIIGDGTTTNRFITLTHREQIKRFASDLIKVVKSQPGKRLRLSQFAQAYEQVLGRVFRVEDYGTNDINVLLVEIWEGTINIIPINRESIINGASGQMDQDDDEDDDGYQGGHDDDDDDDVDEEEEEEDDVDEEVEDDDNDDVDDDNDEDGEEEEEEDDDDGVDSKTNTYGGSQHRQVTSHRDANLKPLFVNVPLPKNPILEQLVAANELVNKPYITEQYPDCWFEIPRRERSDKEIKRTKYFIWDCIELLAKMEQNNYSVPFSKFIPAYHYYFNRQCKVSIFGFSKLIDLFESISPEVVEIVDQSPGEEKLIKLAPKLWPKRTTATTTTSTHSNKLNHKFAHLTTTTSSSSMKAERTGAKHQQNRNQHQHHQIHHNHLLPREQQHQQQQQQQQPQHRAAGSKSPASPWPPMQPSSSSSTSSLWPPAPSRSQAIDNGPTDEELMELEDELKAYEELQAIQRKRSGRMAAMLDIFKYSIY